MMGLTTYRSRLLLAAGLLLMLTIGAACFSAPDEVEMEETEHDAEHAEEEMDHDMEHEHGEERIPNEGAVIRIVSPEDGATIQGDEVEVVIEVENFTLGDEDSHWHVYVDGSEWGMITGGDTSHVLRGIEPGEHEIGVFLALGTHEELEEGDSVIVTFEG